jgi:hypothetical protein
LASSNCHTPMYFFLGNLSVFDILFSSVRQCNFFSLLGIPNNHMIWIQYFLLTQGFLFFVTCQYNLSLLYSWNHVFFDYHEVSRGNGLYSSSLSVPSLSSIYALLHCIMQSLFHSI